MVRKNKIIIGVLILTLNIIIMCACQNRVINVDNSSETETELLLVTEETEEAVYERSVWEFSIMSEQLSQDWGTVYLKTMNPDSGYDLIAYLGKTDKKNTYIYLSKKKLEYAPGTKEAIFPYDDSLCIKVIYLDDDTEPDEIGSTEVLDESRIIRYSDGEIAPESDEDAYKVHWYQTQIAEIPIDDLYDQEYSEDINISIDGRIDFNIHGSQFPKETENLFLINPNNSCYLGKKEFNDKTVYAGLFAEPMRIGFLTLFHDDLAEEKTELTYKNLNFYEYIG